MSPEPDRPDDADPTPPTDPPAGPPAGAPQGPPAAPPGGTAGQLPAGPPHPTPPQAGSPYPIPPQAGPPYPTPPHPGISPEPPGYAQAAGPRPRSFGAGVGIGTGIGCGAYVLGGLLAIALISTGLVGFLIPFVIIAVVGIALMFSARTRPFGTGILIVTAAAWILVLGPCVALLAPGGFT